MASHLRGERPYAFYRALWRKCWAPFSQVVIDG
jgi:hypothetical protein